MSLEQEFLAIEPDARPVMLCGMDALHYQTIVPAHTFDTIFAPVQPSTALELVARSGFSINVAEAVLAFVLRAGFTASNGDAITVLDGFHTSHYRFDTVVCVPPQIARRYDAKSKSLADATTWVFPGYSCEFANGQCGADFWFAIGKGARISVVVWDRQPTPQLRIQALTERPGGMLQKRKQPGMATLSAITTMINGLPDETVTLRVIDLWQRQLDVQKTGDVIRFRINGPNSADGEFPTDATAESLQRFGMGVSIN
jgi:hypothetical protein